MGASARISFLLLEEQFADGKGRAVFYPCARLSFLSGTVRADRWALLPSAAGFVDPLLSTGFPLTLLGISRLADILERDWNSPRFLTRRIQQYASQTSNELLATSRLIAGLYANMNNFSVFSALSSTLFRCCQFFGNLHARLNKPQLAPSFLLHDHPVFGPACRQLLERALTSYEAAGCRPSDR